MQDSKWATPTSPRVHSPPSRKEHGMAPPGSSAPTPSYPASNLEEAHGQAPGGQLSEGSLLFTEEFAHTRPPDDLFDDEFTPIAEVPHPHGRRTIDLQAIPTNDDIDGGSGADGDQAAREGRRTGSQQLSQVARESSGPDRKLTGEATSTGTAASATSRTHKKLDTRTEGSVRGDRSATGGIKKAKLTEDELAARMSAIALKNASLTAAHARATADEASFHAREAHAARRAFQERASRSAMLGERQRNAQRKMQAVQGREWDREKPEQNHSPSQIGRVTRGSKHDARFGGIVPARAGRIVGRRTLDAESIEGSKGPLKSLATETNGAGNAVDERDRGMTDSSRDRGGARGGKNRGKGRGGRGQSHHDGLAHQARIQLSGFPPLLTGLGAEAHGSNEASRLETSVPSAEPVAVKNVEKLSSEELGTSARHGQLSEDSVSPGAKVGLPISSAGQTSWADQVEGTI